MQTRMAALMTCLVLSSGTASAQPQQAIKPEDETAVHRFQTPGMSGYIDTSGDLLIPSIGKCNHLCGFHEGLAAVETACPRRKPLAPQHWGFVDKKGKLVIPDKFRYADDFHEGLAAVNVGGKPDPTVDFILHPPMLDHSGRRPCYPVVDGTWGFVDRRGELVIPPTYQCAKALSDGLALVGTADECLFIDKSGNPTIRLPKESYPRSFSEKRATYKENGRFGYLDRSGRKAIPARFVAALSFSSGLACVLLSDGGNWGHIDKSGAVVIEPRFEKPISFREGLAEIPVDGKWGFIDKTGEFVIEPYYDRATDFWDGMAFVRKYPRTGLKNAAGEVLLEPRYLLFNGPREGLMTIQEYDKVGFVEWKTGKIVIPMVFDWVEPFNDGLAPVRQDGKWGVIDRSGRYIVEPKYGRIGWFREGLAAVDVDLSERWDYDHGKYGFIDRTGKMVIEPQFDFAMWFSEDLAAVKVRMNDDNREAEAEDEFSRIERRWGFIDRSGKSVIAPRFDDAWQFKHGRADVKIGPQKYQVDVQGRLHKVPPKQP